MTPPMFVSEIRINGAIDSILNTTVCPCEGGCSADADGYVFSVVIVSNIAVDKDETNGEK